jgi:hypothetical protein
VIRRRGWECELANPLRWRICRDRLGAEIADGVPRAR